METSDKKQKRIIMITDAEYDDKNDTLLNLVKKCIEEKGISITIIAISSDSNLSLADKLSHFKGCNYFPITNSSDLENFLVKNKTKVYDSVFSFQYALYPTWQVANS